MASITAQGRQRGRGPSARRCPACSSTNPAWRPQGHPDQGSAQHLPLHLHLPLPQVLQAGCQAVVVRGHPHLTSFPGCSQVQGLGRVSRPHPLHRLHSQGPRGQWCSRRRRPTGWPSESLWTAWQGRTAGAHHGAGTRGDVSPPAQWPGDGEGRQRKGRWGRVRVCGCADGVGVCVCVGVGVCECV